MNLNAKIAILVGVPFLGYAISSFFIIGKSKSDSNEAVVMAKNIHFMKANSDLIKELQKERGRTAIYLGGGLSLSEISTQRSSSDSKIPAAKSAVPSATILASSGLETVATELSALRSDADGGKLVAQESFTRYTKIIGQLLKGNKGAADAKTTRGVGKRVISSVMLDFAQENAGQLRALISGTLASNKPVDKTRLTLIQSRYGNMVGSLESPALAISEGGKASVKSLLASQEWTAVLEALQTVIDKRDAGEYGVDAKQFFANITKVVDTISDINSTETESIEKMVAKIKNDADSDYFLMLWTGVVTTLAILIISTVFVLKLTGRISQVIADLTMASDNTHSAAGELASASRHLSEGASSQAAALEESSASLEELSSMTKSNATSAERAHERAVHARQSTEQSAKTVEHLTTAMNEMAKIIKNIDEIAFQTNILALNAAVEAARAGEAGAGFAVVADEVRNLARRSADAAQETDEKIARGVKIGEEVGRSLKEMVEQVRAVDEVVEEITNASKEQSVGISQISTAVSEMDKVTQNNVSDSERTASASEELSSQAASLQDSVAILREIVTGKR